MRKIFLFFSIIQLCLSCKYDDLADVLLTDLKITPSVTISLSGSNNEYTKILPREVNEVIFQGSVNGPLDEIRINNKQEQFTLTSTRSFIVLDTFSLDLDANVFVIELIRGSKVNIYTFNIFRETLGITAINDLEASSTVLQKYVTQKGFELVVAKDISQIKIDIILTDSLADYELLIGEQVLDKEKPLDLHVGFNHFFILVTADDKQTTQQYYLEILRNPWGLVKNPSIIQPRDGSLVAAFKDRLWVIDGWSPNEKYETTNIWSSESGWVWDLEREVVPWINKHAVSPVVYDNKMWVMSSWDNDVWSSHDGINWNLVTNNAPWGFRYSPYVFAFNNKLWLMGGLRWWEGSGILNPQSGEVEALNDVWSSDNGVTWTKELEHAPWAGRGMSHGSVVFQDKMWIVGGGVKGNDTIVAFNDVWSSSDGVIWTKVGEAPWSPRYHFSVAVHDNKLWISDGSVLPKQSNRSNEVWFSDDGTNWIEIRGTPWQERHAANLISFRGSLFILCGSNKDGIVLNDIWKFETIEY